MAQRSECRSAILADGQHAVIAQNQDVLVCDLAPDLLTLRGALGDALKVVISHASIAAQRGLTDHAQSRGQRRHGAGLRGMDVDRIIHVGPGEHDAAVQDETGAVDAQLRVERRMHVDLDKIRRCYIRVDQLVLLDEELAGLARNARRCMIIDEFIPAVMVDQAIHGGQFDTGRPLPGRYARSVRAIFVL